MNQYLQYIVIIGVIVQLIGVIKYIKDTLSGITKPNKVTWLLWSVAPLIATAAALTDGVGLSVLPTFMAGFGPLLVLTASFINKNAYWKSEKFDYVCGICSLLALVFWYITKEPEVAIIFSIVSDGLAAIPTLIKSWKYPETESPLAYVTGLLSSLTSFAAIKVWDFSSCAFPIYLVIANTCLVFAIYRHKIIKTKEEALQ
jgi:hypothetical protein